MTFDWLHVENGRIVDSSHRTIFLRGLNTAGLEFGDGVGSFTQARINAFASKFSMNLWRLAINVSWWNNNVLMTDGVTHYQDWIQQLIGWMKAAGCYVEIDPTTYVTRPPANSGSYCASGIPETLVAADTFTRANQSGWGTPSGGGTWTTLGAAATLSIASNEGVLTGTGASDTNMKLGSGTATDQTALVRLASTQVTATKAGILLRFVDANNQYLFFYSPGGDITIGKKVGGTYAALASTFFSPTSGTFYWLRAYVVGTSLYMRIWADGIAEPNEWNLTATDSSLASGGYGLYGSTSTGDQVQYDHFTVYTPVTSACIPQQDTLNFPPWTDTQIISATNTFYTSFIGIYGSDPAILYDALNEPRYVPYVANPLAADTSIINAIQALQPKALIFVYDGDVLYYVRNGDPDHYTQSNLVWDFHFYDDPAWTWQQKLIDYQPVFDYAYAHNHAVMIGEWNVNITNDPQGFGSAIANLAITQGVADSYYNADNLLQSDNATLTAQGLIAATTFLTIAAGSMTQVSPITITNAGCNLIRDGESGANNPLITYIALGTSSVAPTASDAKLGNEVFRKAVTSRADGATGEILIDMYLAPGDTVGTNIQEVGFFGGSSASPLPNTGVLIAHGLYSHAKSNAASISFTLDLLVNAN